MRPFTPTSPSAGNSVSANLIRKILAELKACRIINGSGYKTNRTPNGTTLELKSAQAPKRQEFVWIHPWKVFGTAESDDCDHCFEIYIPGTKPGIYIGGEYAEIIGISPVDDKSGYYTIDEEYKISTGFSPLRLFVYTTPDEESEEEQYKMAATITIDEDENNFRKRDEVLDIIMTAEICLVRKVETADGDRGEVEAQSLTYHPDIPATFYA